MKKIIKFVKEYYIVAISFTALMIAFNYSFLYIINNEVVFTQANRLTFILVIAILIFLSIFAPVYKISCDKTNCKIKNIYSLIDSNNNAIIEIENDLVELNNTSINAIMDMIEKIRSDDGKKFRIKEDVEMEKKE